MSSLHPYKEKVVNLLYKFLREETRLLKEIIVQYLVYECTSTNFRCKYIDITFQKGKGFTNLFNHLKACLWSGSLYDLLYLNEENLQIQHNNLSQFFKPLINVTKKETTITDCIDLTIEERLHLTATQKISFRKSYGDTKHLVFSQEKLKETLYNMVERFEGLISAEMRDANRELILNYGWTKNGFILLKYLLVK